MDELSIKFTDETEKKISQQRQKQSRGDYIWLLIIVLFNVFLYVYSYFRSPSIWEEGEAFGFYLYAVFMLGYFFFTVIIEIYKKAFPEPIKIDKASDSEKSFLSDYIRSSLLETPAEIRILGVLFGVINSAVYLGFTYFISR